jgi:hypothetical protein
MISGSLPLLLQVSLPQLDQAPQLLPPQGAMTSSAYVGTPIVTEMHEGG